MARSIPPSLAPVVEELELAGADLVTASQLAEIVRSAGIRTSPYVVAARLRDRGWLLPTGQRGVWEFAPGAVAGPYTRGGHTRLLRSVLARTDIACGLTFQAAAWAHGLADRAPARIEVAAATAREARHLPDGLDVSVFAPRLGYVMVKDVPVLRPDGIVVHMAARPAQVRSWTSALEWLPEVAAEVTYAGIIDEIRDRPTTVGTRVGYLLQGMRPDIAGRITGPPTRTWFGPRTAVIRHDSRRHVADTLLPFDPRELERTA